MLIKRFLSQSGDSPFSTPRKCRPTKKGHSFEDTSFSKSIVKCVLKLPSIFGVLPIRSFPTPLADKSLAMP